VRDRIERRSSEREILAIGIDGMAIDTVFCGPTLSDGETLLGHVCQHNATAGLLCEIETRPPCTSSNIKKDRRSLEPEQISQLVCRVDARVPVSSVVATEDSTLQFSER
jgi:hypothetical protein